MNAMSSFMSWASEKYSLRWTRSRDTPDTATG